MTRHLHNSRSDRPKSLVLWKPTSESGSDASSVLSYGDSVIGAGRTLHRLLGPHKVKNVTDCWTSFTLAAFED